MLIWWDSYWPCELVSLRWGQAKSGQRLQPARQHEAGRCHRRHIQRALLWQSPRAHRLHPQPLRLWVPETAGEARWPCEKVWSGHFSNALPVQEHKKIMESMISLGYVLYLSVPAVCVSDHLKLHSRTAVLAQTWDLVVHVGSHSVELQSQQWLKWLWSVLPGNLWKTG